jgi:hypothetical protein
MLMVSSSQLYVRRDSAAFTICQCRFGRQGTGPGCRVGVGCACVLALAGRGVEKAYYPVHCTGSRHSITHAQRNAQGRRIVIYAADVCGGGGGGFASSSGTQQAGPSE